MIFTAICRRKNRLTAACHPARHRLSWRTACLAAGGHQFALCGCCGQRKTCFIQNILPQTMQRAHSIHIIFDPKGDYLKKFYKDGDCILSLKDLPNYPASAQPKWHLLKEMCLYEAHPEEQIREIAKTLFQEAIKGNQSNPYFPIAACNLFSALMIAMCRQYADRLPSTRAAIQKYVPCQ